MENYYFSFGCAMPYRKFHVIITASSEMKARDMMTRCHGHWWCCCYTEKEWPGTSMAHNTTPLAHFSEDDPAIDWEI